MGMGIKVCIVGPEGPAVYVRYIESVGNSRRARSS